MATRNKPSFVRMFRRFPFRTGLFTFGPLAIGLAQVLNAAFHGISLWPVVAVAAVMCVFSVLVTNYHLASFRRRTLVDGLD
jgi:hypothetical protein